MARSDLFSTRSGGKPAIPEGLKVDSIPIGAASAVNASGLVQTPQSKVPRPEFRGFAWRSVAGALPIES